MLVRSRPVFAEGKDDAFVVVDVVEVVIGTALIAENDDDESFS